MRSGAVRHAAPHKVDRLRGLFDVIEQLSPVPDGGISYLEHESENQIDTKTLFFHDTRSVGHRALLLVETEWNEATSITPPAPHTKLERTVNRMIGESFISREIGQLGMRSVRKYAIDEPRDKEPTITREYAAQLVSRQKNSETTLDRIFFDGSVDLALMPKAGIRMAANALSVIDEEEFARIEQMIARLGDR